MSDFKTFNIDIDTTDNYIQYITDKFDLNLGDLSELQIPLINLNELNSFEWNIGLICGESGSGKSTILKEQFGETIKPTYNNSLPVISQFPQLSPEDSCVILESVGLSSVPVWLRKPNQLSVGERARLDLGWLLVNSQKDNIILVDEFTSVINRETAKSLAYCLQRYVKENNLKVVVSSCHFDIIEFLEPDWIFNLNKRKENKVELERFVYIKEYKNYPNIDPGSILTEKKMI